MSPPGTPPPSSSPSAAPIPNHSRRCRQPQLLLSAIVLFSLHLATLPTPAAAWGKAPSASSTPGGAPRMTPVHVRRELMDFPYGGRGDAFYSFHHPFRPAANGDGGGAIAHWEQAGASVVTSRGGRDVVRLTDAARGLQGVVYASRKTRTMDFNGYFDILLGTAQDSDQPADGMGFFFSSDRPAKGSAMGMAHTYRGFGIIVDTFSNSKKRHVPHLFGYVSDGQKEWNPDLDGEDIELTAGCKLRMDTPTRIHIQFLDRNLHVAVSENNHHQKWHTCFKYNNVPLGFSDGGYLAFAGETGHFFSLHELDTVAFAVGDISEDVAVRQNWLDNRAKLKVKQSRDEENAEVERLRREEIHRQALASQAEERRKGVEDSAKVEQENAKGAAATPAGGGGAPSQNRAPQDQQKPTGSNSDSPPTSEPHAELAGKVNQEVQALYDEFASVLKAKGAAGGAKAPNDAIVNSIAGSLKSLSAISAHLLQEIDRQRGETESIATALKQLQGVNQELHSYSKSFSDQMHTLEESTKDLRDGHHALKDDHEDTHELLLEHGDTLHVVLYSISQAKPHGILSTLLFICLQLLLVAGGVVVYKMGPPKKENRMV